MSGESVDRAASRGAQASLSLLLTRRAFLATTSVSAIAMAESPRLPQPKPAFRWVSDLLTLTWSIRGQMRIWQVEPNWFIAAADNSDTAVVHRVNDDRMTVQGRFAGVNIPANFSVDLTQDASTRWGLRWQYDGRDLGWIALDDWFTGHPVPIIVNRRIDVDEDSGALDIRNGALTGSLRFPFSASLKARSSEGFKFQLGETAGQAGTLSIDVAPGASASPGDPFEPLSRHVIALVGEDAVPISRIALDQVTVSDPHEGWTVGRVGDSKLRLIPTLPKLIVEVLKASRGAHHYVVWRRSSAGQARLNIGEPDAPRALYLEEAELIEVVDHENLHGLVAKLTRKPRMIEGVRYAAVVRGEVQPTFLPSFRGKPQIALPIRLQALHVRGDDDARYDVDFRGRTQRDRYLDRSAIVWEQEEVQGVVATLTIGRPLASSPAPDENRLHLGTRSGASVALHRPGETTIAQDGPVLRVRRHADALDLGLLFYDYRLENSFEESKLVPGPNAQRGLRFHPQHLQEEVFQTPDSLVTRLFSAAARLFVGTTDEAQTRKLGAYAPYSDENVTTQLARTRTSGTSRIIFAPSRTAAQSLSLDVAGLTKWPDTELSVPPRVRWAADPLDKQLETDLAIGIHTPLEAAQEKVKASLVEPAPDETALELVTGLTFAPEASARLRSPQSPPGAACPLWSAQLELQPQNAAEPPAQVRAVWASGFKPGNLIGSTCGGTAPLGVDPPFKTSVSSGDRAEVMMLSSAVGLAALRAVTLTGLDMPNSLVRRPTDEHDYVWNKPVAIPNDPDQRQVPQGGIMLPAPFSRFSARLTAFGADVDAEWHGEPVAPTPEVPFFNRAFSVEKYVHRTSLGSDVFVEVVYKGFLFPYGFRVSLIKISDREAWTVGDMGAMMPSIQRLFILPKPVEKAFPGIYQPFGGREIPVRHAHLVSGLSPELDPDEMKPPDGLQLPPIPSSAKSGCEREIGKDRKPVGRVFWPKRRGSGKEIEFEFEADDTGVRRSLPMIFLDNAAVHHAATVKAVVEYYNQLQDQRLRLRTENHHGGRTIFAPPSKIGDTSFETDSLLLSARGRVVASPTGSATPRNPAADGDPPDPQYVMDAFMEGADEPPFYPVMSEATIHVTAVDRLLGTSHEGRRVGYARHYVLNGLDSQANKAGLYLTYLDPSGLMQLHGRGEVSGGVCETPTPLAAITRDNCVAGAAPRPSPPVAAAALASADPTPPVGADHKSPWNLTDIANNRFDPSTFFGDAKLLGIIRIGDVVKAALMQSQPNLEETYDYALGTAAEAADAALKLLQDAAHLAAKLIDDALVKAEEALVGFLIKDGMRPQTGTEQPNLRYYYPELAIGLSDLKKTLDQPPADLLHIGTFPSDVLTKWRVLRAAVDAVVANPAPEPVRQAIGQLRSMLDALEGGLGATLRNAVAAEIDRLIDDYVDPLIDAVIDQCFDAAGTVIGLWPFEALVGPLWPPSGGAGAGSGHPSKEELRSLVRELVQHGAEAIPAAVATAPLAQAVTLPLLRLVADGRRLAAEAGAVEAAAVERLSEQALQVVRSALSAIARVSALVDTATHAAAQACASTTAPLVRIVSLATDAVPKAGDVANAWAVINDRTQWLDLPGMTDTPEVRAARQAGAALRVAIQRVATAMTALSSARNDLEAGAAAWCAAPGRIATAVAELNRRRSATLAALSDCAAQAGRVEQSLTTLAGAEVEKAKTALKEIARELLILGAKTTMAALTKAAAGARSELRSRIETAGQIVGARLADSLGKVEEQGSLLDARVAEILALPADQIGTAEQLTDAANRAVSLISLEAGLLALATDYTAIAGDALAKAQALAAAVAARTTTPLIALHQTVYDCVKKASDLLAAAPDLVLLLAGPLKARLDAAGAALTADLSDLRAVPTDVTKAAPLLSRWNQGGASLPLAAKILVELFSALAKGQIGAVFDLAAARRAIEDAVRRLVPSRVSTGYTWNAALHPFPAGNPIFIPVDENANDGLSIATTISIDLLNPADRTMSVVGTLKPFEIHLLGKTPDLVTITFEETRFESTGGGSPNFKTRVTAVRIGDDLKFLDALGALLGNKDRPFTVTPTLGPPGVLVRYVFSASMIEMGAVTILNVSFEVAMRLPFDGSQAVARLALASKAQPFGIIIAPGYYGGGFVALEANAKGPVSFEIQLEFGAATAIQFGPLTGQGRVTTGIYLLSRQDGSMLLEGFVHAVGEGQIACFGISVNMEVRVSHDSCSKSMKGTATYSFSFRVGFFEVGYSVEASYQFQGGDSGGARGECGPGIADRAVRSALVSGANTPPGSYVLDAPDKMVDWLGYRQHFVGAWT